VTTSQLSRSEVEALLPKLGEDLTPRQLSRLRQLAALIGEDNTIPMTQALQVATTSQDDQARQAAFRQFRRSVRSAADQIQLKFGIEVDGQKIAPGQRRCWFELTDEVETQLADLSRRESSRGTSDAPVGARVQEVLAGPRPTRVYVSAAADPAAQRKALKFVEELSNALRLRADGPWQVTSALDPPIGADFNIYRDGLIDEAHVVVAFISPALLGSTDEVDRIAGCDRLVLAPFEALPRGELKMRGLNKEHLLPGPSYCQASPARREALLEQVIHAIRKELDTPAQRLAVPPDGMDMGISVERWTRDAATRRMNSAITVTGSLRETLLDSAAVGLSTQRSLGQPTGAVDRLVDWATATGGPQLCALLGDVGTGKTTTAKLLTQRLLDERQDDESIPLPLYFDLRDLTKDAIRGNPTVRELLAALLRATEDASPHHPTVDAVFALIQKGNCLVIFDGLDEALVHLPTHEQQLFTRTLWRATEAERGATDQRRSKLLLTCRTHFFRSIRDEAVHFTGQDRESPIARDHLALLMVPFTDTQIRAYIAANVPDADVDAVIATIDATHNLRELAARPLTLRMIVEQLEYIERAKYEGRTVRAVDLYGAIVERWLTRDDGKHSLLPAHKTLLMEHLAAQLWRSGDTGWRVDDVEQWLLEFLRDRPDLETHYAARTPDLWKDDFRTATFLVRGENDEFGFAHTSLREYFVSRYLLRALQETGLDAEAIGSAWSMPVPSPETLDFLGQSLAGLPEHERTTSLQALSSLASQYRVGASELAFAYGLRAHGPDYPAHRLAGSILDGATLRDVRVESGDDQTLDLSGVSFRGADLRNATFTNIRLRKVDFNTADLSLAEFHGCDLAEASMRGAKLVGPIFRTCRLDGIDFTSAAAHRAKRILCTPRIAPLGQNWLGEAIDSDAGAPGGVGLQLTTAHRGWVWSVAFSPDGDRLATSGDGPVRIFDAATGDLLLSTPDQQGTVRSVAFSPDGNRLATSGRGSARIFDAATGDLLLSTPDQQGTVWSVAFSPDGDRLATSGEGPVRIFDAATGDLLLSTPDQQGTVWSVAFSPDGDRLATSGDGPVRIFDAATGDLLLSTPDQQGTVWSVAFSPDGDRLATSGRGSVRIFDAATGDLLLSTPDQQGTVWSVAFSPDGDRLATSGRGSARIFDAATGDLLSTLDQRSFMLAVAFSPDGDRLATSGDGPARIFDAATGDPLLSTPDQQDTVQSVAFSPDGDRLATGGRGSVRIFDAATGDLLLSTPDQQGTVWSVAFSPDGDRLATGGEGPVRIFDAATGDLLLSTPDQQGTVWSVAFSPDGDRLATSGDGPVRIFDAATGDLLLSTPDQQGTVWSVAFSPDGDRLATSGRGSVRIFDAATGDLLLSTPDQQGTVWSVAFSPDGDRLATGGEGPVRIFDAATGDLLLSTPDQQGTVWSVAFSPDGDRLATGGDGSARIFDAATGDLLLSTADRQGTVWSVAFSPDGDRLATSGDGSAWIFHAATGDLQLSTPDQQGTVWSVAFSPDGDRLATGGDGLLRIFDTATGEQVGWNADPLPENELCTWDATTGQLLGASEGAWRWLAWGGVIDGEVAMLPAETFGPLPPLQSPKT
jgi:WD40 repeat protein